MDIKQSNSVKKITDDRYSEYLLSINEFNQPKINSGAKAIIYKIIQLIFMNPGTYPTKPYMGIGFIKNYRYSFMDNLSELNEEIREQIKTYLPEFQTVNVEFSTSNSNTKQLIIFITVDYMTYSLVLDTNTKTLSWLNNNLES
jgi:hypothetical protein